MEKKEKLINYQLLWGKITHYAKMTGRVSVRPVLLLYYVLRSPNTPNSDKILIISVLSYLILPIDLLSAKRLPIIGWIDEIVSIAYAYQKVCKHVTPEIEMKAETILNQWFPDTCYTNYELLPSE